MRADLDDALRVEMDRHQRARQREADHAAFMAYVQATHDAANVEGRVYTLDLNWRAHRIACAVLTLALAYLGAAVLFAVLLKAYGG